MAGAMLLALARGRRGVVALFAAALGLLFALHALFYLVTGVHYGVGDGRLLHRLLGARRAVLVAAGSLLLVGATFVAARGLAARLAGWLPPARPAVRVAILAGAALAAAATHGALMLAEQRWTADPVYAASFQPEPQRAIAAELQRLDREPRTPDERAVQRRLVEERHALFPLEPVLGVGMGLAALAGIAVTLRGAPSAPAAAPPLAGPALACALSLAVVLAIDRLL